MKHFDYLRLVKGLKFFMTIALVAFMFAACASSSDDDDDDTATVSGKDASIPSSMTCTAAEDGLQGTWTTGCYAKNDAYRNKTILVSGDCIARLTMEFNSDDPTCATPTLYYKTLYSGLVIGDADTDSDGNAVTKLDGIWEHKIIVPMIDAIAAQVNDDCSTTLNSGDSVDVMGLACNTGYDDAVISSKDAWKSMYNITGSNLIFASDGEYDFGGREGPLHSSAVYVKQ
jgi:hypothetical protein